MTGNEATAASAICRTKENVSGEAITIPGAMIGADARASDREIDSMNIVDGLAGAVLNTVSDAILVSDREGVVRFWNPGAVRIFGFAVEEAEGQSLDLIIPERLRARHWEGYRQVMATGRTRYGAGDLLSVPALTKDGREISVEFTIIVLPDAAGQVAGMAAILRDVTARFQELRSLRRKVAELTAQAGKAASSGG